MLLPGGVIRDIDFDTESVFVKTFCDRARNRHQAGGRCYSRDGAEDLVPERAVAHSVSRRSAVASPIPARSDASSWLYECVNCSFQIDVQSVQTIPTCPNCNESGVWEFRSRDRSKDDSPDD